MTEGLGQIVTFLKNAKTHILVGLLSIFVFLFVLFPFNDLSDLVSTQVARLSGNQVFVQFEKLQLSIFTGLGLRLEEVYVEGQQLPSISAKEIIVSPSVTGLIAQKPYGSASAHGLLGGDLKINVSGGKRTESGLARTQVDVGAEGLNLKNIREVASLPVPLEGKLSAQGSFQIEPNFEEQPDGDLVVTLTNFELPPASIETQMGPVTLPDLKLKNVELRGRIYNGRFDIQEGKIGAPGDELTGTIKGHIGILYRPGAGPQFGAYSFDIDLKVKRSLQTRANLFLLVLDGYKKETPEGPQFALRIVGDNFIAPPRFEQLRR